MLQQARFMVRDAAQSGQCCIFKYQAPDDPAEAASSLHVDIPNVSIHSWFARILAVFFWADVRVHFQDIPLAPVFHPTAEEFKDPIAYLEKIRPEGER